MDTGTHRLAAQAVVARGSEILAALAGFIGLALLTLLNPANL